jgi:hypothetical protein
MGTIPSEACRTPCVLGTAFEKAGHTTNVATEYELRDEFQRRAGNRLPPAFDRSKEEAIDSRRCRWPLTHLICQRFGAQHSHFTTHGEKPVDLAVVCSKLKYPRLARIIISAAAIRTMKKGLRTCGIVESTIFPDLEGLSRELTATYTTEWIDAQREL